MDTDQSHAHPGDSIEPSKWIGTWAIRVDHDVAGLSRCHREQPERLFGPCRIPKIDDIGRLRGAGNGEAEKLKGASGSANCRDVVLKLGAVVDGSCGNELELLINTGGRPHINLGQA